MTRPRVEPLKRLRTACACDHCKKKKQKCSGLCPCHNCVRRGVACVYTATPTDYGQGVGEPAAKHRRVGDSPTPPRRKAAVGAGAGAGAGTGAGAGAEAGIGGGASADAIPAVLPATWVPSWSGTLEFPAVNPSNGPVPADREATSGASRSSSLSAGESASGDVAGVLQSQRMMLEDGAGRKLYLGESSTVAFLNQTRQIVNDSLGPCEFTRDENRHTFMEAMVLLPPNVRPSGLLPHQKTAEILMRSYFTNTAGLVDVFDRKAFEDTMVGCYRDPSHAVPSLLCLLNLVFAIGLVMAKPEAGTDDHELVQRLRSSDINQAELFYQTAIGHMAPRSGCEDAKVCSVQSSLLTALYMLSVARRSASYGHLGIAVRAAYTLGLHREELMVAFSAAERNLRTKLWRSLFVLDRFISAVVGRPTAILREDCSESALAAAETFAGPAQLSDSADRVASGALDAAVRTCQVIGTTLKVVYARRKISATIARKIASTLDEWTEKLHPSLHWRGLMDGRVSAGRGIIILHVNLLHCHSTILLTRPFLLYMLKQTACDRSQVDPRIECFAQNCVEAAQHSISLAKWALDGNYLPESNPFVIHCVFAAVVIILSNSFAGMFNDPEAGRAIDSAITILEYCSALDAHAQWVCYITRTFHDAVLARDEKKEMVPGRRVSTINTVPHNPQYDPMSDFFLHHASSPPERQHLSALAALTHDHQHLMLPSMSDGNHGNNQKNNTSSNTSMGPPLAPLGTTMPPPPPLGIMMLPSSSSEPAPADSLVLPSQALPGMDSMEEPEIEFDTLWTTSQTLDPGSVPNMQLLVPFSFDAHHDHHLYHLHHHRRHATFDHPRYGLEPPQPQPQPQQPPPPPLPAPLPSSSLPDAIMALNAPLYGPEPHYNY